MLHYDLAVSLLLHCFEVLEFPKSRMTVVNILDKVPVYVDPTDV